MLSQFVLWQLAKDSIHKSGEYGSRIDDLCLFVMDNKLSKIFIKKILKSDRIVL